MGRLKTRLRNFRTGGREVKPSRPTRVCTRRKRVSHAKGLSSRRRARRGEPTRAGTVAEGEGGRGKKGDGLRGGGRVRGICQVLRRS